MTDSNGTIQARYDYDLFGRSTKLSGSLESDFRYTGHYSHASSGLALSLFRGYDPNIGRWISEDPAGIAGGLNLYAYAGNSPGSFVDPLGLAIEDCLAGLSSGLTSGLVGGFIFGFAAAFAPVTVGLVGGGLLIYGIYSLYKAGPCMSKEQWTEVVCNIVGGVAGGAAGGALGGMAARGAGSAMGNGWGNKLKPHPDAQGPHTTYRRNKGTGGIDHYETWKPQSNPRNPNPWESVKRFDRNGPPHYNKETKEYVPTPHVHDPTTPGGVRPALPEEIPL